jgi:hypothetical protein
MALTQVCGELLRQQVYACSVLRSIISDDMAKACSKIEVTQELCDC